MRTCRNRHGYDTTTGTRGCRDACCALHTTPLYACMHVCMYACETACGCIVYRAVCVCVLCTRCPLCLCVFFLCTERCMNSHRTGTRQHAFPEGETSFSSSSHTPDTHSTNLCACRTRIPSHLLSPGLPGNQGRGSRECQFLPRGPLRQRFPAVPTYRPLPEVAPIPSRAVFHLTRWPPSPFRGVFHRDAQLSKAPGHHDLPVHVTSPIKDSDEFIIHPGGRKHHVPSTWTDDERVESIPVDPTSPGTTDPGRSPVP